MIYDITQPVFECIVFPGDPAPQKETLKETAKGDVCNLTAFSMCAHNGTHVDAPFHFLQDGKRLNEVALEKFIGKAYVAKKDGEVSAEDAKTILSMAKEADPECWKKILIKGKATITEGAAKVFAEAKIDLVGNDSQTVGPENAPKKVHLILLGAEIVLLEGTRLDKVPEGVYTLNCAPINLGSVDGAPCRAILMD